MRRYGPLAVPLTIQSNTGSKPTYYRIACLNLGIRAYGGFPKLGLFLGIPTLRIEIFWCPYWGPPT